MITRFAPSPTGPLHLGHAYSALYASDLARKSGGTFLLRIEDIDQSRARPQWEAQIYDDLHWLGLDWPTPVMRQSERFPAYTNALKILIKQGLLYECSCNRRDIAAAMSAPQEGAELPIGPDGLVYPGTCSGTKAEPAVNSDHSLRLDLAKAFATLETPLSFEENLFNIGQITLDPKVMIDTVGDVVLARKGMGTSYHLSVVVDDAAQGVTDVVRGEDLFDATAIHVLLQALLGLPTPRYHHHRLIRDAEGKRLAKRDDARAIAKFREDGLTPAGIREMVSLPAAP